MERVRIALTLTFPPEMYPWLTESERQQEAVLRMDVGLFLDKAHLLNEVESALLGIAKHMRELRDLRPRARVGGGA